MDHSFIHSIFVVLKCQKECSRESCCIASRFPLLLSRFEQEIKHVERSFFRLPSSVLAGIMRMLMCAMPTGMLNGEEIL